MILLFNSPNFSEFQHPYVCISRVVISLTSDGTITRTKAIISPHTEADEAKHDTINAGD